FVSCDTTSTAAHTLSLHDALPISMWGTWWVWDARLTSVLVLFLFYLGYMALRGSIDDEAKAARAAAVLGLVGLINLPIVKFSVRSEEHTSELQSRENLVCRLLLEK